MSSLPISPTQIESVSTSRNSQPPDGFFAYHGIWALGIRTFRAMRFRAKAAAIVFTFMVPMIVLLVWLIKSGADQAMQARMDATRQHVEIAHGVLAWAQSREAAGELTREQAQALAKKAVGALRYQGEEYFWINDMQMRMVLHPAKPELNGKDVGGMKDPNGFALFQAFVDTVRKEGKGFISYQWPKPGSDAPVDKISYVKGFEPWGWIIGSGVYVDDLKQPLRRKIAWIAGVVALVLLNAGYMFFSFYFVMDGGLKETQRHLRAMTEGDLTTTPTPWGSDEAARLMIELRHMQGALRSMVQRVRAASDDIVHSSSEIAQGADDLSRRTEQAAANLEETASSMEEISATVKHAEENTLQASAVARNNADDAAAGGTVMLEAVHKMDGIRDSSVRIGEIIGTINGIAFQTNILALNAAVEAARAGEQGRGFAVVATEVRTLAQRTAAASKEITGLISESVEQVKAGTEIVRKAGETIEDIVASSQKVNQLLGEIADGAREQTLGISQVGTAVHDLDRMTQQNAALVEQTASAAAALRDQADALAGEVARFRLPEGIH
ncbi:MAG TPA: methyl-accepting chemotaxis protein [Noviherbaspirillum sp.]|uniref:methyl-accepting chemotaxis protein n=1 Tax=Noviherbaspirillum sp. TaxID=1926288 RepID=UPI002B48AE4D|nr:methyl-accepting chemotaxis protein [Noviherbaspirillum sp.]HJV86509.1 methyl-accepting chemotaxis protein [Noviherbaspirillum sp.]